jgi:hypothetical protein
MRDIDAESKIGGDFQALYSAIPPLVLMVRSIYTD